MKAAVSDRYGPPSVAQVREIPTPQPRPGELRIRVHASTVTRSDCGLRRPHPWFVRLGAGLWRPRQTVLGLDFAGEVDALGAGVTGWQPGERVFGLSPETYGAHAQYLCLPAGGALARMPAGVPFHECVVGEGAWYADTYLQKFHLHPGSHILIHGGGGAIGSAAVQLAKASGAEVTAVVATRHLALVRALGADHVVDYTTEDFTGLATRFDAVFDAVGKTSYSRCRGLLKPDGLFAATDLGPYGQNVWLSLRSALTGHERVIFPLPQAATARPLLEQLAARIAAGRFRAVIDRRYPLAAIAEAYSYVETQQKTGIVVLDLGGDAADSGMDR